MLLIHIGGILSMWYISNIAISADIYWHADASVDLQFKRWKNGGLYFLPISKGLWM